MKIYFDVKNQIITRTDRNQVIANSADYLEAEITFSAEWATMEKTMTFKNGNLLYTYVLVNDKILEENHLNLGVGTWKVSIQGVNEDKKIVTNECNLAVNASGWIGSEALPPESIWNQLLVIIQSLHTEVASTAALRSAVQKYIEDNYDALVKEAVIVDDVRAALDDMAEDGTLSDLLAPLVAAGMPEVVADQISAVVAAQIGGVVANQIGAVVASQITTPVNQAVKNYCDDNFSGWSGALDRGLAQPLMAAPADMVGEIKSALSEFCVCKNLIGNNVDEYYDVDLPNAIYYLNISTSDGSNFSWSGGGTMKLQLCDASKTVVHEITLPDNLSYRDVYIDVNSAIKYLKLTKQSGVPLMVAKETTILGHAETYIPYFYNAKGLTQVIKDTKSEFNSEISSIESEISTIESGTAVIPSYYESHMASKEATILGLSNADIQCAFVTDAHYDDNAKNSPSLVKHLWQNVPLDFVVSGGDCFKQEVSKADAMAKITKYNNQYAFCGENYFPMVGNHEHNNSDGQHSSVQLSLAQVNLATLSKVRNVVFSDKVSYRFDDAITKCRYYFIGCYYDSMLYDEDVHWFCNDLLSTPNGYSVVVFSHAGLKLTDGAVSAVQVKVSSICNALLAMANKTIYHNVIGADEYINYSNVNALPIAVFSGHVHLDGHYQYSVGAFTGYIEVIATNCDAYATQPVGEQDRTPGTVNEQSFDVISIDRTSRTIYMTRIGYGSDRTFTYYNYGA